MNANDIFSSSIVVEESIGEFRSLLQSHIDVSDPERLPPILFVFDRALERLEEVWRCHQAKCHTALSVPESTAPVPQNIP